MMEIALPSIQETIFLHPSLISFNNWHGKVLRNIVVPTLNKIAEPKSLGSSGCKSDIRLNVHQNAVRYEDILFLVGYANFEFTSLSIF